MESPKMEVVTEILIVYSSLQNGGNTKCSWNFPFIAGRLHDDDDDGWCHEDKSALFSTKGLHNYVSYSERETNSIEQYDI